MSSWAERLRDNPIALADAGSAALHEVLDEVGTAFDHRPWPLLVRVPADRPIQVIGDSHGDWPAVSAALSFARAASPHQRFVALGDYVDRATRSQPDPSSLPAGSVWLAAYLLAWAAHDPERVIPLRGNHETTRQIPVPGPTLLRELRRTYSPSDALALWERLVGLLERLPLAARTENGVFLAHGGIPPVGRYDPAQWDRDDLALLEGLVWSDPAFEYEARDAGFAYDARALEAFLRAVDCRVMLKGHAPNHSGRAIYQGRLLTIHTSDLFAAWGEGGVLMAEIPARDRVDDVRELALRAWDGSIWKQRAIRTVMTEAPDEPREDDRASPLPAPGGS